MAIFVAYIYNTFLRHYLSQFSENLFTENKEQYRKSCGLRFISLRKMSAEMLFPVINSRFNKNPSQQKNNTTRRHKIQCIHNQKTSLLRSLINPRHAVSSNIMHYALCILHSTLVVTKKRQLKRLVLLPFFLVLILCLRCFSCGFRCVGFRCVCRCIGFSDFGLLRCVCRCVLCLLFGGKYLYHIKRNLLRLFVN